MSELYNRIESICTSRNTNVTALCKEAGVARATLSELKAGRSKTLTLETAEKLASVLEISVDELLGKDIGKAPALTKKDERDISRMIDSTLEQLESAQDGLMFDGEPLDDETRELLRMSLQNTYEMTKRIAKQKFTPKKYRK